MQFYKKGMIALTLLFCAITGGCFQTAVSQENVSLNLYSSPSPDTIEEAFLSSIRGAKQSVLVIVFSLTDPKIIKALNRKAEEGVKVSVICDPKGSFRIEHRLSSKIDLLRRYGKGLMHLKLIVIDGETVFLGSANLTTESLHLHANLALGFSNEAVAKAILSKAEDLKSHGKSKAFPHKLFKIGPADAAIWFLPEEKSGSLQIKNQIRSARKTIRIAMFTWTRADFAHAVVDAKRRGVEVEVILDRHAALGAGAKVASILKEGHVPVSFYQGAGLLHHKLMIIDNETLIIGSANWTKAAFTQNDDCFMILKSLESKTQNELHAIWDMILRDSMRII